MNIPAPAPMFADNLGTRVAKPVGSHGTDLPLAHGPTVGIRARAPLRLGLAGGGTDLSPYCSQYGGAILNATLARYAYAHMSFRDDAQLQFSAHDVKQDDIAPLSAALPLDGGLLLHRAVYNRIARDFLHGKTPALTVSTMVDAPPGSGLGASSALVVALLEAYRTAFGLPLGRYDVARLAFEIERNDAGLAGGRQDQYAASFGGVNFMEFLPGEKVIVNPLRIDAAYLREFEASLTVCFTGQSRASAIIQDQVQALTQTDDGAVAAMHRLKADAIEMKQALLGGNILQVAEVLNRSWLAKRQTSGLISNSAVETALAIGMKNGAIAGKVSGAGGGGFVVFMSDPEQKYRLIAALNDNGFPASSVQFSEGGAEAWVVSR